MGKSVGFIGNFKGKLGNTVGYKVSQSNSGTNQGVRVYQPNIKNPKSAAQAEQRAKYAPIFATYRALKMIIDRGNESKPYGNASRIAWLKKTFRAEHMPWYPKGAIIAAAPQCQLTFGTLNAINFGIDGDSLLLYTDAATQSGEIQSVGLLSQYLMGGYPWLKQGDQVTIIVAYPPAMELQFSIFSYILDENDDTPLTGFTTGRGKIVYAGEDVFMSASVIVSREGAKGEHLRSKSWLMVNADELTNPPYNDESKQSAIASYMATNGTNADWAEESIQ